MSKLSDLTEEIPRRYYYIAMISGVIAIFFARSIDGFLAEFMIGLGVAMVVVTVMALVRTRSR